MHVCICLIPLVCEGCQVSLIDGGILKLVIVLGKCFETI